MTDNQRAACRKLCVRSFLAWGFTIDESGRIGRGENDEHLRLLSHIVLALDGMYDGDAVVRSWMKTERKELGGATPMAELLSGAAGARRVHDLVRLEANR